MSYQCTQESFLRDIDAHKVTVLRDEGLYRHIRFSRPGTRCYQFDFITWPGHLCYTGDMGTFVFSRTADMLEFFRTRPREGAELHINPGYWSEKIMAGENGRSSSGAEEFDPDKFARVIKEQLVRWMREDGLDKKQRHELRIAVEEDVLEKVEHTDASYSYQLANSFSCTVGGQEFQFQDLWDYSYTRYTHRFIWCCYALAWGIQQYDLLPSTGKGEEHE